MDTLDPGLRPGKARSSNPMTKKYADEFRRDAVELYRETGGARPWPGSPPISAYPTATPAQCPGNADTDRVRGRTLHTSTRSLKSNIATPRNSGHIRVSGLAGSLIYLYDGSMVKVLCEPCNVAKTGFGSRNSPFLGNNEQRGKGICQHPDRPACPVALIFEGPAELSSR